MYYIYLHVYVSRLSLEFIKGGDYLTSTHITNGKLLSIIEIDVNLQTVLSVCLESDSTVLH